MIRIHTEIELKSSYPFLLISHNTWLHVAEQCPRIIFNHLVEEVNKSPWRKHQSLTFFPLVPSLKLAKDRASNTSHPAPDDRGSWLVLPFGLVTRIWRVNPAWQRIGWVSYFDPAIAPLIERTVALSWHLNTLKSLYSRQKATVCFPEGIVRE